MIEADINMRFRESVKFRMRKDKPAEIMAMTWAMGLAGESGEVIDIIKKHIGHDHPLDRSALVKELGDVEWYIEAVTQSQGIARNKISTFYFIIPKPHHGDYQKTICKRVLDLSYSVGSLCAEMMFDQPDDLIICSCLEHTQSNLNFLYEVFGITREEVLEANIFKLEDRYPNGFSVKDSLNRKE